MFIILASALPSKKIMTSAVIMTSDPDGLSLLSKTLISASVDSALRVSICSSCSKEVDILKCL